MRIQVLGDFSVLVAGRDVTPSAPKLRQILAVLALRCNEVVHLEALVDEVWADRPPRNAAAALHTYVYELRRELFAEVPADATRFLQTRQHGYVAQVPAEEIDVTVFERLVADGGTALSNDDAARAREHLGNALSLYRGRALANIRCGELLTGHVTRLEEGRLRALDMRIEADLLLGRHQEVIGELRAIVGDQRFHEGFHAKLMLALHRSGRRNEALDTYQVLRRRLVEELGIEPGRTVQRLQRALVSADAVLEPAIRPRVLTSPRATPPAQLPRDIPDFTARETFLRSAEARLTDNQRRGAIPILSIRGMPGVGKTAAAVHLAHAVRDSFPDGQLFARLGGTDATPGGASEFAALFLRGCGMAATDVPACAAERTAALRTWSADRRALVVLDDAASADQVQALLPSGAGCAVIVTSRLPLYGLPGVETSELAPFDVEDGRKLLARILGEQRVAAEPAAAIEIVRMMGGLPLALRLIGQRLTAFPGMRLGAFLATLSQTLQARPLSALSTVGLDLHAALASSYRKLSEQDQRAFRLLLMLRDDQFSARDAARVLLVDPVTAELALLRLADAHFVQVLSAGTSAEHRYVLHSVMRAFALECLMTDSPPVDDQPADDRHLIEVDPTPDLVGRMLARMP
ncbi:BTAD domain-containing putative transcriptional regulator [Phytohabitans sp. LJ34]|uniref:AfsR/SARP family transcriptional regulator n=1 Tax=Phytohabitans sp. LJ34 TaxID=3452217 RepID=UPI003F894CB7